MHGHMILKRDDYGVASCRGNVIFSVCLWCSRY